MNQPDDDSKQSRFLPMVKESHNSQDIHSLMSLINRKKNVLQQELSKHQINEKERPLKYLRSQSITNTTQQMSVQGREAYKQQLLARGSSLDVDSQPSFVKNKNKLLKMQLSAIMEKNDVELNKNSPVINKNINQSRKVRYKTQPSDQYNIRRPIVSQFATHQTKDINIYQRNGVLSKFYQGVADLKRGGKTNQKLERVVRDLQGFNPFFRKIQRVIAVCLLRIGKIVQRQAKSILYTIGAQYDYFFIILTGRVKLNGHEGMHKICESGESVLEQIILSNSKQDAYSLERGKIIEDCYLLQIDRVEYLKLMGELLRFGFKQGAHQLQTMIKRNSIIKNWLRNKFKLLNNN